MLSRSSWTPELLAMRPTGLVVEAGNVQLTTKCSRDSTTSTNKLYLCDRRVLSQANKWAEVVGVPLASQRGAGEGDHLEVSRAEVSGEEGVAADVALQKLQAIQHPYAKMTVHNLLSALNVQTSMTRSTKSWALQKYWKENQEKDG